MADEDVRPIIIRRKNAVEGGHHGGAWKVAYADFVTAMMAFFLLMWLLNATTEDQRKGLADYFSPSIPVHRTSGGGEGPFAGDTVQSERTMTQSGTGASKNRPTEERQSRGETGVDNEATKDSGLQGIAEALLARGGESAVADRLLKHVRTRVTDEGLVIEAFDLPDMPLFEDGEAVPTQRMRDLMVLIGDVVGMVTNSMAIDNHLRTPQIRRPETPGWTLTASRALVVRQMLSNAGTDPERFQRVTGEADRVPVQADPQDVRNERTEIILLRSDTASDG